MRGGSYALDELAAFEPAKSGLTLVELVVLAGVAALLAIIAALWWLRRAPAARQCADGTQEITICVRGCFSPDRFRARRGVPLRIHFERDDSTIYAGHVFFPDFGVERSLAPGRVTTVELLPERRGEFLFTGREGVYAGVFHV